MTTMGWADLATALLCLVVAADYWPRRRQSPMVPALVVAAFGATVWSLSSGLWLVSGTPLRGATAAVVGGIVGGATLAISALWKAALLTYRAHLVTPAAGLVLAGPLLAALPFVAIGGLPLVHDDGRPTHAFMGLMG